jgi:hypothetical protein
MIESNRRRVLAGTCATLLAAILLFHGTTVLLDDGTPHSRGAIAATGFLTVLTVGLTVGAVLGITQLVRRKRDGLGLTGAALAILGATVGARIMVLGQLRDLAGNNSIMDMLQSARIVWASIVPIGLMYPIGLMLLGIAIISARPVHRWIGVALAIGGLLFPVGRAIGVGPAIYGSDAILALAYASLGWQILTRPALWHEPPVPA